MSLVSSLDLMQYAKKKKLAIPAFNVDNLESCMAVCEAVKELQTPVIIQTIPRTINYGGVTTYTSIINALMADTSIDYCLHLDHGVDIEIAKKCQKAGYSSVMIDGSQLPLNDNINLTKEGVDYMKPRKISVEGELGAIGGKEEGDIFLESKYTKVSEAIKFASETGVDTLAIGVGTAHGVYKGTPKINFERIKEINKAVDTPLVLHGATGLSDDVILKCIDNGITKINYATELRLSFTNSLRQSLQADLDMFDPKIYMRKAIDDVKTAVIRKIRLLYKL